MITRCAIFSGKLRDRGTKEFRAAEIEHLLPIWNQFASNQGVRVNFADDVDEGALLFPLILAIDHPSVDAMDAALAAPTRHKSKDMTADVKTQFFEGKIHHQVVAPCYDQASGCSGGLVERSHFALAEFRGTLSGRSA